jgi:hypothetical protein
MSSTHPTISNSKPTGSGAHRCGSPAVTGPVIGLVARQVPGSMLRDGVSVYGYPDLDQREPIAPLIDGDRVLEALRGERAADDLVSVFFRLGLNQDVQAPSNLSLASKVRVGYIVVVDLQR